MRDVVESTHVTQDAHSIFRLEYHNLVVPDVVYCKTGDPRLAILGLDSPLPQLHQPIGTRLELLVYV
jgi:hypothetical protein